MRRTAPLIIAATLLGLSLSACANPEVKVLCRDGLAFATSSDSGNGLIRVPEWDDQCQDSK